MRRSGSKRSVIVATQVVRNDVALLNVIAEGDDSHGTVAAAAALLLAEDGERRGVVGAAGDHLGQRVAHDWSAVGIERHDDRNAPFP
jgi:hypothetical protein